MDLDAVADELYGLRPEEFVAARDRRALAARKAGDQALAKEIGALRRPSLGAWVSNLLVRRQRAEVEPLLGLGEELRRAHRELDGARLRELARRQSEVIGTLGRQARRLAAEAGRPVGEAVQREVEETLHAALADPGAAREWAAGRLVKPLSATFGFPEADEAALDRRPAIPPTTAPRKHPEAEEPGGRTTERKRGPAEEPAAPKVRQKRGTAEKPSGHGTERKRAATEEPDGHATPRKRADAEEPDGHATPRKRADAEEPDGHATPRKRADAEEPDGHATPRKRADAEEPDGHAAPRKRADAEEPGGRGARRERGGTGEHEDELARRRRLREARDAAREAERELHVRETEAGAAGRAADEARERADRADRSVRELRARLREAEEEQRQARTDVQAARDRARQADRAVREARRRAATAAARAERLAGPGAGRTSRRPAHRLVTR
ncbi:hypothetical protein QR97_18790 [Streptomyces sp. PBH53]|uniref:hypothetical protein n=1 Tax=Streptomyces sp. PBH53 TaxID=1577075 RepID=UPI0006551E5B|nr:hypothetical protein [Streptomyces sp. PBH53]AKN71579.1 hypothetical protein QR97_18790 [Streptomyces sp. PBH53]